mmetsp:Transcript_67006/g.160573  ORF Transcript_67006/g.160573 Transcript_67006/m.160573 type:complete len:196 (+) Transcript_67006:85-672(+)|eukprot:CAMPEP_0178431066 /NCGR_PEP_ID=MMETSP0689_2-20121128/31646_1 /TAXON_ID=160604 /ORGANISM="Amphidinium massartii, Strain CS-259" /LENGTH=195 /DNA_ID=CAMNT_0020052947 /DNA_START=85 /DNA_END=672 /DNA_ORIENTATION=-
MGQNQCCCCMEGQKKGEPVTYTKGAATPPVPKDGTERPGDVEEARFDPTPSPDPVQELPPVAEKEEEAVALPPPVVEETTAPEPPQPEPAPAPAPAPAEPEKPKEYTITIKRKHGHKLGMTVGTHDAAPEKTLVRDVKTGGLVDAHNASEPYEQLNKDDQVVSVNGATTPDAILKALADQSKDSVVIVVCPKDRR